MADACYLDHLAVASEHWDELWPRYRSELGGTWVSGDHGGGFAPAQLRYANNMKLEVLMPYEPEHNDFLRRFLDRRGPGPHHITFKVPNIVDKIAQVEAAGYTPVGVDLRDPGWKEAFLHPKDAPGIVVQLAEAPLEWSAPEPSPFPPASISPPASFDYVGLAVSDVPKALALFVDLLDGATVGTGRDELYRLNYTELSWTSGGVIRVFETDAPSALHHAAFTVPNAGSVAGAKSLDDGRFEIAPDANFGVRLVLRNASA